MEAEKEKTFYFFFKPIGMICKGLGIFPVQNIILLNESRQLKAKVHSFATLYSLAIFAGIFYMIYYFSGFLFSSNKSYFLFLVVYVMIGRSIVCFLFCVTRSKKLPKLVMLLDAFDKKRTNNALDGVKQSFMKDLAAWTIMPIFIGFMCYGISIYESMNVVLETIPMELTEHNVAALCFGLLSTWQVIPLQLYIYFALKIVYNFDLINKTLRKRKYVGSFFDEKLEYDENMHKTLEYLRYMHNMMAKSVKELGKCYGNFMAIDQLFVIAMVVVNICTFINDTTKEFHLLILTFFNTTIVLIATIISQQIKEQGSKIVDLMDGIRFSEIDEKSRIEIQTFLMQLTARPIEVDAAGYYIIDKHQIPSMMSSIATYLIVTFQFLDQMSTTFINGTFALKANATL